MLNVLRRISVGPTLIALCASLIYALPAAATTDSNLTVSTVGAQGTNGFVVFSPAPSQGCLYNDIYFPVSSDDGKAYYALLLTARASHLPISRVDYTKNSDGTCTMNLVQM